MNHKRGKPKGSRAGCTMCKPWKHQSMKGGLSPEAQGARNFRLTQDRLRDLLPDASGNLLDQTRSQIARELEAMSCDNPFCDCHFDSEEHEEQLLEAVTGDTAKKLAQLNVTITWAT